ncbi:hypothetical protein [Rhizocola hellebori]|uniref:hypothetical protein n=1 Tax=Rhizocola hellebori TaxID=1392758 RepID=UPI001942AC49|nr:hypothetical protein [Rhizocola hellebori]
MGTVVTLDLPDDAPQHDLPWIITIGSLDEGEDWEAVFGPYEYAHANALAEHAVADDNLLAVVEPLLPATTLGEIRDDIARARQEALESVAEEDDDVLDSDFDFDDDYEDDHDHEPASEPTPEEIRAGFARLSARLTQP